MVVQLAGATIGLVKKLVKVEEEARIWLVKLEQMRKLNQDIQVLMGKREERTNGQISAPPLEKHFEKRICNAVLTSEACLKQLNSKLSFLEGQSENDPHITISERFRYLLDRGEIEQQAQLIDKHVDDISLSLQLLLIVDSTATRERVEAIYRLLSNNQEILATLPQPTEDSSSAAESPQGRYGRDRPDNPSRAQSPEDTRLSDRQAVYLPAHRDAIMISVKQNDLDALRIRLRDFEHQEFLQAVDDEGWTTLHHAVHNKAPAMLKTLLEAGLADVDGFVDRADEQGHTALMKCANISDRFDEAYEMAQMLLDSRCDVNFAARPGGTALYHAIGNTSSRGSAFVDILIRNSAKVSMIVVESLSTKQLGVSTKWLGEHWPQLLEKYQEEQREEEQPSRTRRSRPSSGRMNQSIRRAFSWQGA